MREDIARSLKALTFSAASDSRSAPWKSCRAAASAARPASAASLSRGWSASERASALSACGYRVGSPLVLACST